MPSRFASLLLAATSVGAVTPAKSKKPAVMNLMESAKMFLKNGATPDVVEFADSTLNEIESIVIPAIINESESDQRFINSLHSRFEDILMALALDNQEVHQLNAEETAASEAHKGCRDTEGGKCTNKRTCEMELYHLWTVWVTEEEELRQIHATIDGHFCPPGSNGTLHQFRVQAVGPMELYMAQKVVVDEAERVYDIKVPVCTDHHSALDSQSNMCNAAQTALEEKACAHAQKINDVLSTYYTDHAQASSAYNCAVEEIMQLEMDRKREWVTLQVVNCLLNRVHEFNGRPCDTETGEVDEQVAFCEEHHGLEVCSNEEGEPRLCLNYPPIPQHPPNCASRHEVTGRCLPVQQPVPCNPDWEEQEYGALPVVPVPPFSSSNPGCNAYPECSSCAALEAPHPIVIDSCPGYTVDGCDNGNDNNGAGEIPLTYVRNVEGTADVRCCSIDGTSCQSQDFPTGIDFITPNAEANTHEGCIFGVTYQEALTVCHTAGMRICGQDEMHMCCGTGCWHNHHAVWVDITDQSVLEQD